MNRKLRTSIALLAALALSGLSASAASAEYNLTLGVSPGTITAEQIPHVVEGEERNYFEITSTGTRTECTSTKYSGTTSGSNVTSLTVHPIFSGCVTAGFASTFDTTGCDFVLTGETGLQGHGKFHLECEPNKAIEITIPSISCTIKIHAQTPTGGGWTYTNTGSTTPDDIHATATVTGITYERIGNGFFCTLAAPEEGNDTDFVSKITMKAYGDPDTGSNQVSLTVS